MKVYYDKKNDVVTIYLEKDDNSNDNTGGIGSKEINENRDYEVEEAAGLLLDMVDLVGENGDLRGFRVFNASQYYDLDLLNCADLEELTPEELSVKPTEKVIKRIG